MPDDVSERKTDRDRFLTVAPARVNRALNALRLVGRCSSRLSYDYSESEGREIVLALEDGVERVKQLFDGPVDQIPFGFSEKE